MNALNVFSQLIREITEDIQMETVLCDDGSGSIDAVTKGGQRLVSMTFQQGFKDGCVYDYRKIGTDGYLKYCYSDK